MFMQMCHSCEGNVDTARRELRYSDGSSLIFGVFCFII